MRILGFGAHPDDAEIFFGTLAAARAGGAEIDWAIATDGSKGGKNPAKDLAQVRRAEAKAAAALLDVEPVFLDSVDGALSADREAASKVEAGLLAFAPDLVITHAPNDYHPDHRVLSVLVCDAARFRAPVVYADTLMGVGFAPTIVVDVTKEFDLKQQAIRCHASQRPERFVAACEIWNRFRSLQCNAQEGYAEAFRFEPSYPFADIRALMPAAPPIGQLLAVSNGNASQRKFRSAGMDRYMGSASGDRHLRYGLAQRRWKRGVRRHPHCSRQRS